MIELDEEVTARLAGAIDASNVLTAAYVNPDEMHPMERQFDPEAKGVPVVVDLDRFTQLSKAGKVAQER